MPSAPPPRSLVRRRLGAFAADCALLFAVLGPLSFLVQRALGVAPTSGAEIYATLVVSFSLPTWLYFTWGAVRGATLGQRWLGLEVAPEAGGRLGVGRALARTAVKLAPWEIAHASAFLLAPTPGAFGVASWVGLGATYALSFLNLFMVWRSRGRRSVHDGAASTAVGERHSSHT